MAAVLTACQPFTTELISSNRRHFKYCWYWRKNTATGFCFAKYQPMRCIEDIAVFYRKMPTYHPQGLIELASPMERDKRLKPGGIYKSGTLSGAYTQRFTNYPRNVLEFQSERGLHPTQKPVALFEYLIRTYTNEGDIVLDSCMGSGTTAVACVRSKRNFIGFEIGDNFYNAAVSRVEEAQNQCQL